MAVLTVPEFRILAVRQPHANRIASGEKPDEFRSWTTDYRGAILVVASGIPDDVACSASELRPRSCAICLVDLVDVERERMDLPGYVWHLQNPRPIRHANGRPVTMRPRLNLGRPNERELGQLGGILEIASETRQGRAVGGPWRRGRVRA